MLVHLSHTNGYTDREHDKRREYKQWVNKYDRKPQRKKLFERTPRSGIDELLHGHGGIRHRRQRFKAPLFN
ncbi:hypothetical protein A5644_21195 [Mycobacterium intracellulare subsp. yongonense]|nr:hypothetical protein A5644_21195 [Mycobacterium intracellulare subsp. yongonense]